MPPFESNQERKPESDESVAWVSVLERRIVARATAVKAICVAFCFIVFEQMRLQNFSMLPDLAGFVVVLMSCSFVNADTSCSAACRNWSAVSPLDPCSPTGNEALTYSAFNVQGSTAHESQREFLVNFGLVSKNGAKSQPPKTPFHDKVTLYAGILGKDFARALRSIPFVGGCLLFTTCSFILIPPSGTSLGYHCGVAEPGTGDVWAINPLVTQAPNSGDYAAQGIELDFNNNNAHRGDEDAGAGLGGSVSCHEIQKRYGHTLIVLWRLPLPYPCRYLTASR